MRTLDELVASAARRTPTAPAIRAVDAHIDYAALDRGASWVAAELHHLGIVPGDRVALWAPKSIRCVTAIVGILRAGCAYVPIDPAAPLDRARTILEQSGATVLFCGGVPLTVLGRALPAERPKLLALFDLDNGSPVIDGLPAIAFADGAVPRPAPPRSGPPMRAPIDADLAYILFTSGSTGRPKGVAITHAQSLAFVEPASEIFELVASDVVASHASFNFDLSIIDLFCTFAVGASVALIPERYLAFPARIGAMIQDARITVWNSVPSALIQLTHHGHLAGRDLSSLRLVMFAGEPYPSVHLARLAEILPRTKLLNVYGQTEANSSTYFPIATVPKGDQPLPIGKTFPNYEVFALDLEGRRVSTPGVEGELYVRSNAVASGYWNDPERTGRAFVQNPLQPARRDMVYRTGDRVTHDADGNLIFLGRADAVVKVRGVRVELGELESIVLAIEGVSECAAIAVPHQELTNQLVIFYAPAEGVEVTPDTVIAALARRVSRVMIPEKLISDRSLPRTPNGKIDRRSLVDRAAIVLKG